MIVKAWNNGAHSRNGKGYGFRVSPEDRDVFFKKEWASILLEMDGEPQPEEVKLDEAFWSEEGCELMSQALGRWLRRNGLAPWVRGNPPSVVLEPVEENRFRVEKPKTGRRPF